MSGEYTEAFELILRISLVSLGAARDLLSKLGRCVAKRFSLPFKKVYIDDDA